MPHPPHPPHSPHSLFRSLASALALGTALAACASAPVARQVDFTSASAPAPDGIVRSQALYLVPNPAVKDTLLETAIRERLATSLTAAGYHFAAERDADIYIVLDVIRQPTKTSEPTAGSERDALYDLALKVLAVDGATYRRTKNVATLWRAEARTTVAREGPTRIAEVLVQPTLAYFGRATPGAVRLEVAGM